MEQNQSRKTALRQVEALARLMDNRFRVPGTQIRFGLDPILGLVPGVGDLAGFLVSALLLATIARNGASGFVLARMTLNILLDAFIGSIPLLGDVFDFAYKSNQRNIRLLREHYEEGRHRGSAWKLVIPLMLLLAAGFIAIGWLGYKLFHWLLYGSGA